MSVVAFGPFQLSAAERRLTRDGEPILIGSRAMDLLITLVERAGVVVGKRELIACAWPDLQVEECNLRVQIARLRRALGDTHDQARYIACVAGRGYSFVCRTVCVAVDGAVGHETDDSPVYTDDTTRLLEALVASGDFARLLQDVLRGVLRREAPQGQPRAAPRSSAQSPTTDSASRSGNTCMVLPAGLSH